MELLEFCIAIFFIITLLFWIFFRRRLWAKMWDWVLSEREKKGLETESLQKFMEGKGSLASILEAGKDSKKRTLIRIVTTHLVLYMLFFLFINYFFVPCWEKGFWIWDTRYISPTARNIILLVIVIIVFPLVSVVYELERRKFIRKKKTDIQNKKNPNKITKQLKR